MSIAPKPVSVWLVMRDADCDRYLVRVADVDRVHMSLSILTLAITWQDVWAEGMNPMLGEFIDQKRDGFLLVRSVQGKGHEECPVEFRSVTFKKRGSVKIGIRIIGDVKNGDGSKIGSL